MKIDLGIWNNIFSIPTKIVDEYITTSDANQIKVLLYLLRHVGKDLTEKEISEKLLLKPQEVSNALNYWVANDIINNKKIQKAQENITIQDDLEEKDVAIQAFKTINNNLEEQSEALKKLEIINKIETIDYNDQKKEEHEKIEIEKKFEPIAIAPRLTLQEAIERINQEKSLKFLIDEIPKILNRNITSMDTIIIISFIDWTGMDIDLVLMLINYCASINKRSAKMIEKEAYKWINQGISTHEQAENFIKENLKLKKLQQEVMYAFHKTYLTDREKMYIKKWHVDFRYDIVMIRLAYETAVTRKGERSFSYINGILLSWFSKKITKPSEIYDENKVLDLKNKNKVININQKNKGFFQLDKMASFSLADLDSKIEN